MEQNVAGDLFIERLRAQAVGSGQVQHPDMEIGRRSAEASFLAFDGDAGVVSDFGPQSGQGIEEGSLAAIGVAGQDYVTWGGRLGSRGTVTISGPGGPGSRKGIRFSLGRAAAHKFARTAAHSGRTKICSASCLRKV